MPTADLTHVVISRLVGRDVQRQNVNLEQYLYQPQLAPPLPTVQAGDVIAVQAATPDQQVVFVLGQVGHPGPVNLPTRRSSVLYALAAAGGPLPTADREQVRIIRPGAGGVKVQLFDLKALTDSTPGAALANPPEVEAGDVVSVDELGKPGRGILVLGAVGRQGRLPVDKGMTVIDVIGLAGGLTQMADVKRAKLIRASGEVIVLDLLAFSKEGAKQPLVQDGDTLAIANLKDTRNIFDELMRYLPFVSFFYRP